MVTINIKTIPNTTDPVVEYLMAPFSAGITTVLGDDDEVAWE